MLLVQRAQQPSKGKLDFPGGFVDYNGSNEQALITELLEELQLPIDNMEYLFCYPNRYLWLDVSSVNSNELAFFHQGKIPWGVFTRYNHDRRGSLKKSEHKNQVLYSRLYFKMTLSSHDSQRIYY